MDETKLHDGVGPLTYAKLGKLTMMLEQSEQKHVRTYAVLVAIVRGKLSPSEVKIIPGGWEIQREEPADGQ